MTEQIKFDVFHGQLTPSLAQIYVRARSFPGGGAWKLTGQVRGPECMYAKTLPASTAIVDTGPGETLLAKATLTDPCYWSSDLPSLYRLKVELRHAGQVIATHEQLFGMRFLGSRRRFFYLSNQRWVLRGAFRASVAEETLPAWRELATAMIVEEPSQELCLEASRIGVVLIAIASVNSDIRRLAQCPAISMILFDSSFDVQSNMQSAAPNVILGVSSQDAGFDVPEWSQATMIDAAALPNCVEQVATRPVPLIVCRRLKRPVPLAEARAACDALQRDVVNHGDFAGYVV